MITALQKQTFSRAIADYYELAQKKRDISKSDYKRVFKAVVTDYQERMVVEEGEEDIKSVELPVYSLECPFEYNDICEITYKIAHPLQAQRIVAVAKEKKPLIAESTVSKSIPPSLNPYNVFKSHMNKPYKRSLPKCLRKQRLSLA